MPEPATDGALLDELVALAVRAARRSTGFVRP
jgi:hypothetical protein